ncbi:hypothetical protein Anapl_15046 [Anas platyrhynchos]|uniref:Uncharacterized protein n=1 Tax=Anas platyrhynchos TaxID=8839 RepID=R0M2U7_ANAPL|nr:hypothetical protein Anapl_15046 [Anas platyrhynchos]
MQCGADDVLADTTTPRKMPTEKPAPASRKFEERDLMDNRTKNVQADCTQRLSVVHISFFLPSALFAQCSDRGPLADRVAESREAPRGLQKNVDL